ncbi:hypothetical protein ACA910_021471 [Epithemia clementina (nom. ined.)]
MFTVFVGAGGDKVEMGHLVVFFVVTAERAYGAVAQSGVAWAGVFLIVSRGISKPGTETIALVAEVLYVVFTVAVSNLSANEDAAWLAHIGQFAVQEMGGAE